MTATSLSPEVQAWLKLSAQHLLDERPQLCVQVLQQQWLLAQRLGDRSAQYAVREQVTALGKRLQSQRSSPHAKALWLALMGLRCSMLMPRLRF